MKSLQSGVLLYLFFFFSFFSTVAMEKSRSRSSTIRSLKKNSVLIARNNADVATATTPPKMKSIASASNKTIRTKEEIQARNSILLCSIIYGSSYIAIKLLQQVLSHEMINVFRFSIATTCFLTDMYQSRQNLRIICIGLELGFWCALGFLTQSAAIATSTASKAALFTSMAVVIPPILDSLEAFFWKLPNVVIVDKNVGQKKSWKGRILQSKLFSATLAFIGAVIVECGEMEIPHASDLYLLVTPISFAMCFWKSEKYAEKYKLPPRAITGYMMLSAALFFAIWAIIKNEFPLTVSDWSALTSNLIDKPLLIALLLFIGLLATAFTAISEQNSFQIISAADTSIVYAIEPVFAAFFSYLFLNETTGWNIVIGAIFIVTASILH